jgi:hypothetical protein
MLPPLLLAGIVSIGTMLIQLAAVTLHYWNTRWRFRIQLVAMIGQVQIWVDGWYVTSVWTDALTGRSYTFHSHLIDCGLEPVVGEGVIVHVDPANYRRYRVIL